MKLQDKEKSRPGRESSESVTTANGEYTRVAGLEIDAFSRERMDKTLAELEEERAGVAHLL